MADSGVGEATNLIGDLVDGTTDWLRVEVVWAGVVGTARTVAFLSVMRLAAASADIQAVRVAQLPASYEFASTRIGCSAAIAHYGPRSRHPDRPSSSTSALVDVVDAQHDHGGGQRNRPSCERRWGVVELTGDPGHR